MYCPPALILSITSPTVSVAFTSKVKALAPSCAIVKEPAVNPAVSLVRPVTPPVRVIVLNPTTLSKLLVAPSWAVTEILSIVASDTYFKFFNVGILPERSQILESKSLKLLASTNWPDVKPCTEVAVRVVLLPSLYPFISPVLSAFQYVFVIVRLP